MLYVCPTDVVHASPERVWDLIATPGELARWTGTKAIDAQTAEQASVRWCPPPWHYELADIMLSASIAPCSDPPRWLYCRR